MMRGDQRKEVMAEALDWNGDPIIGKSFADKQNTYFMGFVNLDTQYSEGGNWTVTQCLPYSEFTVLELVGAAKSMALKRDKRKESYPRYRVLGIVY